MLPGERIPIGLPEEVCSLKPGGEQAEVKEVCILKGGEQECVFIDMH